MEGFLDNIMDIIDNDISNITISGDDDVQEDSQQAFRTDTQNLLHPTTYCNMGSVEFSNLNKILALNYLKMGNELMAVSCLVESHAVILRQQAIHRYLKTDIRTEVLGTEQSYGLNAAYLKFNTIDMKLATHMKSQLSELPKEWYVLQITGPHQSPNNCWSETDTMYISVLPTAQPSLDPICMMLSLPKSKLSYNVCNEIQNLLSKNRSVLEATYANNESYWKMREKQNTVLKVAIKELEYSWLREWRILFVADPIENDLLVEEITQMIEKLICDYKKTKIISERSRWLLKKVALGSCFLSRVEIARAVKCVLKGHDKLATNIILSIQGMSSKIQELENAKRKTLVLIVDENMDFMPFESLSILYGHPVTRFPSLHIAYALFKEHQDTIQKGCKIIKSKNDMGICIVNPSGNLSKMEKRMRTFIEYWLPNWKSCYNVKPKEEEFENALVNHEILMYNGHGSGIQYLPGEQIERLKVRSIVLLFGCSSVKLFSVGGRFPPYGISNQYLIAASPCVLGMLWEVTDADIDKMTAHFMSNWIPSTADRPWSDVDTNAWVTGTLKFEKRSRSEPETMMHREPEMLRAVANAKHVCSQFMTAAAIVVRGLPVKLI